MNNNELLRSITPVLSDGLASAFRDEKKELYERFGTAWVASADLWETDMLSVLWALGGSEGDSGELYDCELIGKAVKSVLDGTTTSFKYVGFLLLTEAVVTHFQNDSLK